MTAAKKKAQRELEKGEPDSGKLPEGTHEEPTPDPSQSSDPSNPEAEDPEGDEPEPEAKKKAAPAPARDEKKSTASAKPSALGRFFGWWFTDLDGE